MCRFVVQLCVLSFLLTISILPAGAQPSSTAPFRFYPEERKQVKEQQIVRIGLFDQYGFFHSRDNALRGYMPALFESLGHLAGWKVEWVSIDLDKVEESLKNGTVDLVCGMILTPERTRIMQYSEMRAGMYATTLHVSHDKPVHYMDFKEFDGLRIGFFEGSYHQTIFEQQARKNGFSFIPVMYRRAEDLQRDFLAGKIDGYVNGNLFGEGKIAGIFDIRPFYFVSLPNDTKFMPRINTLLNNLQILSPQAFANFANQYVDVCKDMNIALNAREDAWVKSKPTLRVALSSYEVASTRRRYDLFLQRFVERLAGDIGIQLEFVMAPDYPTCLELVRKGKADIITNVFPSQKFRKAYGIASGLPYYSPLIELATKRKVEPGSGLRIGAVREMLSVREAYSFIYPQDGIRMFPSIIDCRAALERGEIDAYIPFYPGVPYSRDRAGSLIYQSTQALYPMALGFGQHLPEEVLSVFSKAIAGFSTAEVESLLLEVPPLEGLPLLTYLLEHYYGLVIVVGGLVFLVWARSARREMVRLRNVAYTDSVTGGGNLSFFLQKASEKLRREEPGYIVSVNIRQLGHINQLFGYESGDKAIRACHATLVACSESGDLAAHSGRGRFLCFWNCRTNAEVEKRLQRVFQQFSLFGDDLGHIVILAVGIVRATPELGDVARLVEAAETAKNSMGDITYKSYYAYYSPELEQERLLISHIENRMEAALSKGEFQVFIQPQFELATGKAIGGEALVRWRTAGGDTLSPAFFIPIFEKNGFVQALDLHVLEQVCSWLRRRLDEGKVITPISINQSRSLFLTRSYGEKFLAILNKYHIPRSLVTVEITESMAECDMELLLGNLRMLKQNNMKIALDDFGKGYSSLSTLLDFPIDVIKLDKDFLTNARYEVLLGALMQLSRNLGLLILCEGIETREQYLRLRELGCVYGQGFFMARPMPLAEYEAFLEKGQTVKLD